MNVSSGCLNLVSSIQCILTIKYIIYTTLYMVTIYLMLEYFVSLKCILLFYDPKSMTPVVSLGKICETWTTNRTKSNPLMKSIKDKEESSWMRTFWVYGESQL